MKSNRYVLVYQGGIANVFRVRSFNLADYGRDAVRVYQGDFRGAEGIAEGLRLAGKTVKVAKCNLAGDIVRQPWSTDLDSAPFNDKWGGIGYRALLEARGETEPNHPPLGF